MLKRNQKYTVDNIFYSTKGAFYNIRQASLQIKLACDLDIATC
jgi:hypothetical protein